MRMKLLAAAVPVGAAAGVLFYLLKKKTSAEKAAPSSGKEKVPSAPKDLKTGRYSFISGFRDAVTVEMALSYDAGRFCFAVLEDGFLAESDDSHVGVLYGEEFSAQFEYAAYYAGEDFQKLSKELAARHRDLKPASCGAYSGVKYRSGDSICMDFPIPEDAFSYLHVTLVKGPENDDELEAIPDYPDVTELIASITFERR